MLEDLKEDTVEWYNTMEPFFVNATELREQELEQEEIGVDVGVILWGIGGVVLVSCVFKLSHFMWKRELQLGLLVKNVF